MIRHQQDVYNWKFYFLAAGEEAIQQAVKIGIDRSNYSAFANNNEGFRASTRALHSKVRTERFAAYRDLSYEEDNLLRSPLGDLVKEEYEKED